MKEVASTIKNLAAGPVVARILDRAQPVDGIAEGLLEHWAYDLYSRKPGPALLENGVFTPTDLDLACFLSALADRKAVVSLPAYQGRRPRVVKEGEHFSGGQRYGKIMGLVANREVLSFSLRIVDASVVTQARSEGEEDQVGAFRNFMLVDIDGSWHGGWKEIEFMPNRKENAFLADNRLWTGHKVVFSNFVHPNRWTSFYGQYYLATKLLMARLEEEAVFLRAECKRLLSKGVRFPSGKASDHEPSRKVTEKGDSAKEVVTAFECEVDAPWVGEFLELPLTPEALAQATDRARLISYTTNPSIRFPTRATELAFYQCGMMEAGMPAWIKGAAWEVGHVPKGARSKWNRLVLHQNLPGQPGFALRYRTYEKTEKVAAEAAT